jgi:DNA-binding NarL/FixJ family response regulator
MIKLILADDQIILRDSLKYIIEQDDDIKVIAAVSNGLEAYKACKIHNPHLILMDIEMPEYNGIQGTTLIKKEMPNTKILILTTFDDYDNVFQALQEGADGYILKDIKPDELILTIRNVHAGLAVIPKKLLSKAMKNQEYTKKTLTNTPQQPLNLTKREFEIVTLIVHGKSNKEIAKEIFLSEGTIKNMITNILEKLELRDRTQLAVLAVRNGIG